MTETPRTETLALTPSQTVGPYLTIGLVNEEMGSSLVPDDDPRAMRIRGQVLDGSGDPVPDGLVEIWQANAAGRYPHPRDQHNAPTDPNFTGAGRTLTDEHGRFRFVTIRPGEYPWRNHYNAWRPAHIHFSLFGPAIVSRLITQMYFPGDPLLDYDPMFTCVADEKAKQEQARRKAEEERRRNPPPPSYPSGGGGSMY